MSVKQTKHLRNGSQSSINQLDDYLNGDQKNDWYLINVMIICVSIANLIARRLTLIAGCFLLVAIVLPLQSNGVTQRLSLIDSERR